METKEAVNKLVISLNRDKGYYIGWKANIAMAYVDEAIRTGSSDSEEVLHLIGHRAAENFLNSLIKINKGE